MRNETLSAVNSNESLFCANPGLQSLAAPCRTKLEGLKNQLVSRLSAEFPQVKPQFVSQAVLEAHALASLTSVPYLVLPTLAEEKVVGLSNWTLHQQAITRNSGWAFAA